MTFLPVENGITIGLRAFALKRIPGIYCLPQCLRFTGRMNDPWRGTVANIPYLSELDMQAMGHPNGTLSFSRQDGSWLAFPVAHTRFATEATAGTPWVSEKDHIAHGLMVRETVERAIAPRRYWDYVAPETSWARVSSGMYWERTAYFSTRHPADCLHAWVDVDPLEEEESREIQGKFYYLESSKEDLLARWRQDFPRNQKA